MIRQRGGQISLLVLVGIITVVLRFPLSATEAGAGQRVQDAPQAMAERYQPELVARVSDVERNGGPPDAWYCASATADHMYIGYVYEWTFSDAPWWGQVFGYPSHGWDYEPILAEVDLATGDARYYFDAGHYRVASTEHTRFHVVPGSHYYSAASLDGGAVLLPPTLRPLEPSLLQTMHARVSQLPRLPFGHPLGLQWLCDSPESVVKTGAFSGDAPGYGVPRRISLLAGLVLSAPVGLVVGLLYSLRAGLAAAALSAVLTAAIAAASM